MQFKEPPADEEYYLRYRWLYVWKYLPDLISELLTGGWSSHRNYEIWSLDGKKWYRFPKKISE